LAFPKEIQDLIDSLSEQDPFEMNSISLSSNLLVETGLKWIMVAIKKAEKNPRLLNKHSETAKKLRDLAEKFDQLNK